MKLGKNGMDLALGQWLGFFTGRHGVAVSLHQPEVEAEQGKKDGRQHHDVQGEEALHGELVHVQAAAQHVGDGRADPAESTPGISRPTLVAK